MGPQGIHSLSGNEVVYGRHHFALTLNFYEKLGNKSEYNHLSTCSFYLS